jgi:hypothetical protein
MEDKKAPHAARVSAANSLLDRGWGRPKEVIEARAAAALSRRYFWRSPRSASANSRNLSSLTAEKYRMAGHSTRLLEKQGGRQLPTFIVTGRA